MESKPSLILGLGVGGRRGGRGRPADAVVTAGRVHRIARRRRGGDEDEAGVERDAWREERGGDEDEVGVETGS